MRSPPVVETKAQTRACSVRDKEWRFLSIDATMKSCLKTLGQATYRDKPSVRALQPIPEAEAVYRIVTVKGARGGVLFVGSIQSESAEHVVAARTMYATQEDRAHIPEIFSHCT